MTHLYWNVDIEDPLHCKACGVTAQPTIDVFEEVLQVDCSSCRAILFVLSHPTGEETREAAAAGNPRAEEALPDLERREARRERAQASELRPDSPLPRLDGDLLVIHWDLEELDDEVYTVLRHGDREIWRELAYWEGYKRFAEVARILRATYGKRLRELRPTPGAKMYLYGDKWSASDVVDAINARLANGKAPDS